MATQMTTATMSPEPARARPVFSTEDADLLKTAVLAYIRANEDSPESVKYNHLYHRLGRLG
jgi:predicted Zn-dependent peptidase